MEMFDYFKKSFAQALRAWDEHRLKLNHKVEVQIPYVIEYYHTIAFTLAKGNSEYEVQVYFSYNEPSRSCTAALSVPEVGLTVTSLKSAGTYSVSDLKADLEQVIDYL